MIPLSAEKDASLDKKNDKNRKYPVAGRDSIVKAQIIQTAFDLFAQYGIKSISMDMIAHSIGISKRTVYEYFNDKETLLIEGINFYKEKIRNAAEKAFRTNDSVLKAILFFYKELLRNPRWYSPKFFDDLKKFPLATDQMNELRNNFSKGCSLLYQKGVDSGIFIKDLNFEIIALLAKKQIILQQPSNIFSEYSSVEVYNTILFTILRGISTDKGREIIDQFMQDQKQYLQ